MSVDNTLLKLTDVSKRFAGLLAVQAVDFEIQRGRIYSLIGPNGAGKTTIFNLITGYHQLDEGAIWYMGGRIDGKGTTEINRLGIARAFQIAMPFQEMTVRENVRVGALFGREGPRDPEKITQDALKLTGLEPLAEVRASALTVGNLRKLEVARALSTRPELLLADEPCAGLNATETEEILDILRTLRGRGITIWLVEHDMRAVMSVSEKIFVLDAGMKIAEGSPDEVSKDPRVIEAYLGHTTTNTP